MKCLKNMLSLDFTLSAMRSYLIRYKYLGGPWWRDGRGKTSAVCSWGSGKVIVVMAMAPQLWTPEGQEAEKG